MTEKEALDSSKFEVFEECHCGYIEEELKIAIEALEKQIAKEPEVWANGTEHCPCCEKDVTNMYFKVCIECGQRLKEGEVDENRFM